MIVGRRNPSPLEVVASPSLPSRTKSHPIPFTSLSSRPRNHPDYPSIIHPPEDLIPSFLFRSRTLSKSKPHPLLKHLRRLRRRTPLCFLFALYPRRGCSGTNTDGEEWVEGPTTGQYAESQAGSLVGSWDGLGDEVGVGHGLR